MRLASRGIPLPFACVNSNKRSLVSVTNLVDLIITCLDHPKASGETFLVSDDYDVSTSEMIGLMANSLSTKNVQIPVPLWLYRIMGKVTGKSDVVDRLIGSLQLDISHTKKTLGWTPPQSMEQGFKETAKDFLEHNKR